ncbi:MAG: hypothetical protein JJV98_05380 [Desulfosarcina sp.]|nr:hypothetical protein [Desulfobacterales bacterium]
MIASLTSLNHNTINRYLIRIRERIYTICERQSPFDRPPAALDDDPPNTAPIFGLKEDGSKVRTDVIPVQSAARLRCCLRANGQENALCLPERWAGYDGIVDMDSKRLYGLAATGDAGADTLPHGRVIEAFLGLVQKRLLNRHLTVLDNFRLHLKECEFRFNHREENIYQILLKLFRERPLA